MFHKGHMKHGGSGLNGSPWWEHVLFCSASHSVFHLHIGQKKAAGNQSVFDCPWSLEA